MNITAPQGARKRSLRRKHSSKRSAVRMLSPHRNNNSVFSRTCAGKRHPKSRERGDRKGVNGGKREGERSEQESVVTRLNLSLRQNKKTSFPGHAPGKDTLRAANAATKEGFTGRKRVKRKRLPVVFPSFPEKLLHYSLLLLTYSYD